MKHWPLAQTDIPGASCICDVGENLIATNNDVPAGVS